jgi:predicted TIM-barrel fold metal-dependent hydrolase
MKPIFDCHAHCGPWCGIPTRASSPRALAASLERSGIDRGVVSSARALLSDLVSGNDDTARAVEAESRLYGYVYVDPLRIKESIREIERFAGHPKFVGLKTRDSQHGLPYDSSEYRAIFAAAASRRLPALLHVFSIASMKAAFGLARGYPGTLILAHMAGAEWPLTRSLAPGEIPPNVVIDPVSSFQGPGKYELAVRIFGEGNVLFGSDCNLFHPGWTLGAIESAALSADIKNRILCDNSARIFGWGEQAI